MLFIKNKDIFLSVNSSLLRFFLLFNENIAAILLYGYCENFVRNMAFLHDQSTKFIIRCLFIDKIHLFKALSHLHAIINDKLMNYLALIK